MRPLGVLTLLFIVGANASFESSFRHLKEWLEARGSPAVKLEVDADAAVRGLQFTERVAHGDTLLAIPTSTCISASKIRETMPALHEATAFAANSDDRDVLLIAAYLLYLKNSRTTAGDAWSPYFDILPSDFHLPVNYSATELTALRGSNTLLRLVKHQWGMVKALRTNLKQISSAHPAFSSVTLEDVTWAYSVVQSRSFNLHIDAVSNETDLALVPMVDLMNHDSASIADIRMTREGPAVVVTANGDFEKGASFVGRYLAANISMASWVASYGFVNNRSMYQGMRIDHSALWRSAEFDADHQEKLKHLMASVKCDSSRWGGSSFGLTTSGFTQSYLFCMRLALLSPADYNAIIANEKTMSVQAPVSTENERAVTKTLLNHLRRLISEYSTTLEEDSTMLLSDDLSSNMRSIVELRRREKALYFYGIRWLRKNWLSLVED